MVIRRLVYAVPNYGTAYQLICEKLAITTCAYEKGEFPFHKALSTCFQRLSGITPIFKNLVSILSRENSVSEVAPLTEFQKPFRRMVVENNERFKKTSCILGSSLVFGFFVQNCVTISCPDGSISTMCYDSIFKELLNKKVRQIAISWPVLISCIIRTTNG